jgi:Family of unknown function (DUF5989)
MMLDNTSTTIEKLEGTMTSLPVEIASFLLKRKKFWVLPTLLVIVLFGGLLVLAEGSVIAPFIYAVF